MLQDLIQVPTRLDKSSIYQIIVFKNLADTVRLLKVIKPGYSNHDAIILDLRFPTKPNEHVVKYSMKRYFTLQPTIFCTPNLSRILGNGIKLQGNELKVS